MNRTAEAECQLVARDFYDRPANFYAGMSRRKPNQSTIRAFIQSAGRPHTEAQKAVLDAKDAETRGQLKKRLPFWQVQSAPTGRGADAALEAPQNDVLILDIDCHDGERLNTAAIVTSAREWPFTLAIMSSASGRGLAILIAVSPELSRPWESDPTIPRDSGTVEAAQAIVFDGASRLLDVAIDPKANNPERIRFQCASLEWFRDEDAPVVPYNAPDALDMIRAALGIPRAIPTPQEAAEREESASDRDDLFRIHPISRLATAYQGDAGPGSMGTAAAIATIAALVDIRTDVDGDVHAARARVVVLAYSGAGKSDMCDAMADATERHGIVLSNPKTTARLREDMRRAGTETVTNSEGEKGVTAKAHADHVLCIIDEAGDHLHQRTNDLSGLDLLGFFRELHGAHILLEGLKDAPSMRIPAAFTGILWSTPEQYARFSAEITGTDGENRRVLEFIEPKPETAKTGREALARRLARRANEMMVANIADTIAARFTRPGETIKATEAAVDTFDRETYPELTGAGIDEAAAISLTFNYAAFFAVARIAMTNAGTAEITPEDIRATSCVLRATAIRARAQLAEIEAREDDRKYKPENAVWCEIRDRIQGGNARRDKMLAWLSNRPPVYRETYDGMIARGELTADREGNGKRYVLRFTRPEERTPTPPTKAGKTGKTYGDCDEREKRDRFQNYVARFEQDNPIIEGQRDNNLRKLRGQLGKAGMSDEIGRQEFEALAMQRGLTQRDAARLWRQGNLQA